MVRLLGLGIVVQIGVCALLGTRLLWLAGRTRGVPEAAFGGAFLLLGALGYPLSIAARSGAGGPELAGLLLLVALAAQDAAALCIAVGTWRTFRAAERWPAWLIGLAASGFAASLVGQGLTVGFVDARDGGAWYYLGFALRFSAFVWTCGEAFGYYAKLKKRLVLELADPVVTDRIRLWGLCSLLICLGFFVFLCGRLLTENVGESVPVLVATSLVSLAGAATMKRAFFPSSRYLTQVRQRS